MGGGIECHSQPGRGSTFTYHHSLPKSKVELNSKVFVVMGRCRFRLPAVEGEQSPPFKDLTMPDPNSLSSSNTGGAGGAFTWIAGTGGAATNAKKISQTIGHFRLPNDHGHAQPHQRP